MVALEKLDFITQLSRGITHELAERLEILLSVDIGLTNAKHIDVRPIHNKKSHEFSSAHRSCAARNHYGKQVPARTKATLHGFRLARKFSPWLDAAQELHL